MNDTYYVVEIGRQGDWYVWEDNVKDQAEAYRIRDDAQKQNTFADFKVTEITPNYVRPMWVPN